MAGMVTTPPLPSARGSCRSQDVRLSRDAGGVMAAAAVRPANTLMSGRREGVIPEVHVNVRNLDMLHPNTDEM